VVIIGASFDTVEAQAVFAEAESFPFTLISDVSKEIGAAYSAKRTEGMPYFEAGIPRRISYLIAPDGTIAKSYDLDALGGDLNDHSQQVLDDIAAAG
jgi:peroxiredoxin